MTLEEAKTAAYIKALLLGQNQFVILYWPSDTRARPHPEPYHAVMPEGERVIRDHWASSLVSVVTPKAAEEWLEQRLKNEKKE